MMTLMFSQAAALAGGVMLASSPARASEESSTPGNACQPLVISYAPNVAYGLNGTFVNSSTTDGVIASCPIQRDLPDSSGQIWAGVFVHNPAGHTTTCTLVAADIGGGTMDSEAKTVSGTGWQEIYFSGVTSNTEWGTYSMWCILPPGGILNGYGIHEY
jgi:hypothetical protein